jgi:site-specific DNA-methyltransferase (adenine-specific)
MPQIELINDDCMNVMAKYPDKYFDLAIVDPPYGLNIAEKFGKASGKQALCAKKSTFAIKSWDSSVPDKAYFDELFRVSKNQCIWGWNYFVEYLTSCQCYVVWNKHTNGNFADCETAWTSFKRPAIVYDYVWNGMLQQDMKNKESRIHPTQKPVNLYKRTLNDFAAKGAKIIDTHLGSGSIAIACNDFGCDLVATEIDKDYYDAAVKRFHENTKQQVLF